jgi:hypothetical protein
MKIVPVQRSELGLWSSSGNSYKDTVILGRLKDFFSVDHENRWPVQGWTTSSGGDPKSCDLDREKLAAKEGFRVYTLDKDSRWPLQGWCKGRQPGKATSPDPDLYREPSVQSRWPQGW